MWSTASCAPILDQASVKACCPLVVLRSDEIVVHQHLAMGVPTIAATLRQEAGAERVATARGWTKRSQGGARPTGGAWIAGQRRIGGDESDRRPARGLRRCHGDSAAAGPEDVSNPTPLSARGRLRVALAPRSWRRSKGRSHHLRLWADPVRIAVTRRQGVTMTRAQEASDEGGNKSRNGGGTTRILYMATCDQAQVYAGRGRLQHQPRRSARSCRTSPYRRMR